MIFPQELGAELSHLGRVIGLVDGSGNLNSHWFEDPVSEVERLFANPTQRAGLMSVLDALLPAAALAGLAQGEKWHPLLGNDPSMRGNLYLTVKDNDANVLFGVAGDYSTAPGTTPSASLRAQLPLISAHAGVHAIAGTADGPLSVELRLQLGWTRPAQPIALDALVVSASLAPAAGSENLVVTLAGLDLDGRGAKDTILDPQNLGTEATHLILGLIQFELGQLGAGLSSEQQAVVDHLLPLLGLGGGGIPSFPFLELSSDGQAIQKWFGALLADAGPPITVWLSHLAGLLGSSAAVTGSGTATDPWTVSVFTLNDSSTCNLTLAKTDSLQMGMALRIAPDGANPVARIDVAAVLASLPLAGTGSTAVLPSAFVGVRAPGSEGAPALVSNLPAIGAGSIRGGFAWDGSALAPFLELDHVTLAGTFYPSVDLTHADAVFDDAILGIIAGVLGGGAGQHLLALTGITAPTGDPIAAFHKVDPKLLATNPARAIAAVHRAVLVDSADNWSYMFGELIALLQLPGSASGSGTEADPWRVTLGSAGPLNLEFAAWNAATAHGPAEVQKLRIGLRASATRVPFQFWWLAELISIDLPLNAEGSVSLLGALHATFTIQPLPTLPANANFAIAADSVAARMDWSAGGGMSWQAGIQNVQITIGAAPAVVIPSIAFPPPAIDVTNPAGAAAALGIPIPQLELVLRMVLARALLSWGAMPAYVVAALLGVHGNLPGLPASWPTLADPAGPGSLLADPFTALRNWLAQISTSSTPFLLSGLSWLQALLSGTLPDAPDGDAPAFDVAVASSGNYDDPWSLPLTDSGEVLIWLDPAGPPASWAQPLAAAPNTGDFSSVVGGAQQLAAFVPMIRSALDQTDPAQLAASLSLLANHLAQSDGVVPSASQIPTGGTWQTGTLIRAAHPQQPADDSSITQILGQIDTWAGTGPRAVLLLGPAFSAHDVWSKLLASPLLHGTVSGNSNFDFRTGSPDPSSVDLTVVTDAVDYYTADLLDDGTGHLNSLTDQMGRVVARIGQLRPGVQVTLIAHSTAGVPARVFTAANPSKIRGLITLGTPHSGAPLPFLTDTGVASALRFVQQVLASIPAGSLHDAFQHMVQAADGYTAAANANQLATKAPYPVGSFNVTGAGTTDTGGVNALALGGTLADPLLAAMQQAIAAMATTAAAAATPAPTHLGIGLRCGLILGDTHSGDVEASATVRLDAFRVALNPPAAPLTAPQRALAVRVRLSRPGDWLLGGPSSYDPVAGFVDVRVRWAELGLDISSNGIVPSVALHQSSFHGPMSPGVAGFTDEISQPLLGAVFQGVTAVTPAVGSSLAGLVGALQALGIAVPDPHAPSSFGLSADAWSAIGVNAAGYLGPRLNPALATGIGGFTADGSSGFQLTADPITLYVAQGNVGVRTASLAIPPSASLMFDVGTRSIQATLQIAGFTLRWNNGTLTAGAPPWLKPIAVVPAPSAATLQAALSDALPRLLLSGAFTAVLEAIVGPGLQVPPIDSFFSSPGQAMQGSSALGSGTGLSVDKLNQLLTIVGQVLGVPGPGLNLPGNLQLIGEGTGTTADPTTLHLHTTAPIAGIFGIDLAAAIDSTLHVTLGGQLTAKIDLPGSWLGVDVAFGATPAGVSLSIAPHLAKVSPIQILPKFSGLGDSLRGALTALLPQVLDDVVNELGPPAPGTVLQGVLDVATALGIYGPGGFLAFSQQLRALTQGNSLAGFAGPARPGVATAIQNLFTLPALSAALPGTVQANGGTVTWNLVFAAPISGTASVSIGWDASGPAAAVNLTDLKLNTGGLTASVSAGYFSGVVQASADLSISLQSTLGLDVSPKLHASVAANKFSVSLLPLSIGAANGPVIVSLAPSPGVTLDSGGAEGLVTDLLLPLAGSLALSAVKPNLTHVLWTGGPTIETVLANAHLINKGATPDKDSLAALPSLTTMVGGLMQALAGNLHISVSPTLAVSLIADGGAGGNRYGIALSGAQEFQAGAYTLKAYFGAPAQWGSGMDEGLGLYLFQAGGPSLQFQPGLHCVGVGLGITGQDDAPLIDISQFRLGGVNGYFFFDVDFAGGLTLSDLGAGLELNAFGIPLGQATGGGTGGNPVAAGLLQSQGAPGDNHPVNPACDVSMWAVPTAIVPGPANDGKFHVLFGDKKDQPLWIPVHAGFGPVYIDQLGVGMTNDPGVDLLIDGSVQVDGLTAQADDLSVSIPFRSLMNPGGWTLDLAGLAVGFTSPGVTLAGGLLKNPGPPIEYDGMLLIEITEFGFVAVGAYSQPGDAQGKYASLLVFAGVFVVVGIPPVIEVDGFGLGVGYNRQLIVPDDPNLISSFILVDALNDGGKLANDPMGELMSIRQSIPARRGSFWLAVGLHGTSFTMVHVTAVVYVALDRALEVGVLGIARMALPADDTALVSIELALKARFSTSEGLLSTQAQLTDNSWLLSPDCQLTGGFAYFMWFPQSQFVLSIGGYNPNFQKPPQFPDVPRLGYHWALAGAINIKGESYFALTNTCVMAGARMEATYGPDCIHIWFTAYTDFLLSWDPFYYDVAIGLGVGAEFHMEICFIGCVDVDLSVSLSASLHVSGPPLHGEVTVDLAVASVTVAFGPDPHPDTQFITDFGAFALKYLYGNDPNGYAVATHLLTGLLPPEPAGAKPAPGTADQPWRIGAEFSFQTETRMPATSVVNFATGDSGPLANVSDIDCAPMGLAYPHVASVHHVVLERQQNDQSWAGVAVQANHFTITDVINQFSEATWHYIDHDNIPAAARTIPGLGGLQIAGFAVTVNQSALIPIAKLIDAGNSRPLPFATLTDSYLNLLLNYGAVADQLSLLSAGTGSGQTIVVAGRLLAGAGFFGDARAATGITAQGLPPVALNALYTRRSAPPLIAAITMGLTMRAVGLASPPAIRKIESVPPIPLQQPRLRAVLQPTPQPVADVPPAYRTTVSTLAIQGVARMAPPRPAVVAGARLEKIPAANAVRQTAIASAAKTVRHPEAGWPASSAASAALKQSAADFITKGVTLASGASHVWDIPPGAATLAIAGTAALRVTFLSRSGAVLDDQEFGPEATGTSLPIPTGAQRVVAYCLGIPPAAKTYPQGFGALSASAAPGSDIAATGWQNASMLLQVGGSILLGRGATVRLPRPFTTLRSGLKTNQTVVRASEIMGKETAVETTLPIGTGVIMILLDRQDATAAGKGDFGIAADGVTLTTPPLRVEGGNRRALLYQVALWDPKAVSMTVSTASVTGWRLAGVVGLSGSAQDWAVRMNGSIPVHLVPEGPLTPDGQVNIRFLSSPGGAA